MSWIFLRLVRNARARWYAAAASTIAHSSDPTVYGHSSGFISTIKRCQKSCWNSGSSNYRPRWTRKSAGGRLPVSSAPTIVAMA